MLDDQNVIAQKDPQNALGIAAQEYQQLQHDLVIENVNTSEWQPKNIVVAGMGGSGWPADILKRWLNLPVPFEVVRNYTLPSYVGQDTLFIASSYSGNTEESLSALNDARQKGAHIAIVASGGELIRSAQEAKYSHVVLPTGFQPRMAGLSTIKGMALLLESFGVTEGASQALTDEADWLQQHGATWSASTPTEQNYAKQLAEKLVGKTPVIYTGSQLGVIGYKWKISFNENAKNVAFNNEFPEISHNEFQGWASHPIEKPYGTINIISSFEHPRILKRFEVTDKMLSGRRPAPVNVHAEGTSLLQHLLWSYLLGEFTSIYLAILNGVNPTPVDMIEDFKKQLNA